MKNLFKNNFQLVAFMLGNAKKGFNVQGKHYVGVQVLPLIEQAKNDPELWDELCAELMRLQNEWALSEESKSSESY